MSDLAWVVLAWAEYAVVLAVVAAAFVALAAGCGDPVAGYREAGSQAVEAELSSAGTVQLAGRAWLDGNLARPTVTVLLDDADRAAGKQVDSFGRLVPPGGAGSLRPEVSDALTAVADAVADTRIALHRDDRAAVRSALSDLGDAVDRAERLAVRLR